MYVPIQGTGPRQFQHLDDIYAYSTKQRDAFMKQKLVPDGQPKGKGASVVLDAIWVVGEDSDLSAYNFCGLFQGYFSDSVTYDDHSDAGVQAPIVEYPFSVKYYEGLRTHFKDRAALKAWNGGEPSAESVGWTAQLLEGDDGYSYRLKVGPMFALPGSNNTQYSIFDLHTGDGAFQYYLIKAGEDTYTTNQVRFTRVFDIPAYTQPLDPNSSESATVTYFGEYTKRSEDYDLYANIKKGKLYVYSNYYDFFVSSDSAVLQYIESNSLTNMVNAVRAYFEVPLLGSTQSSDASGATSDTSDTTGGGY